MLNYKNNLILNFLCFRKKTESLPSLYLLICVSKMDVNLAFSFLFSDSVCLFRKGELNLRADSLFFPL